MTIQKIIPFLWYAKEAEEAAAFYASIFPDSRITGVTALPSGSPSGPPGSVKGQVRYRCAEGGLFGDVSVLKMRSICASVSAGPSRMK